MNFETEYNDLRDDYQDFLTEAQRIVGRLLYENKIPLAFNIYGRLKTLDSIYDKFYSKRFNIKRTLTELDDLVGVRIVVLFPEFVDKVKEIIGSEFKPIKVLDRTRKEVDKFGYSSLHIIAGINEEWKSPEWRSHINKRIEFQIRTLSEHIWAETSRSLFYAMEENIPNPTRRDFHRLAALLEIVDEKVQSVRDSVIKHFDYIKTCEYSEILKMDLNPATLERVLLNYKNDLNFSERLLQISSPRIESEYEIRSVSFLDDLIRENLVKINFENEQTYLDSVYEILDKRTQEISQKQDETLKAKR